MQIRMDSSICLCLSTVILLHDFPDIFSYITVALMNCVSQEQNADYSSEPHNLCEGDGDGSSTW